MKVLLIYPPLKTDNPYEPVPFPLGLGYVASSLRTAGHQTFILDASLGPVRREKKGGLYHFGLDIAEIVNRATEIQPDIIGISVPFTSRLKASVDIAQVIRKALPEVHLISGGMHATVDPTTLLENGFDAVILGEAETTLPEYLEALSAGELKKRSIDGIACMDAAQVKISPQTCHLSDIDQLPFPARDLVPFEEYIRRSGGRWIRPGVRIASIISSRGCPYRCTYCSAFRVTGRKYRRRSPENVLEEINDLVKRYSIKIIAFEDDNLTADRKRAIEIFEGIARRFPKLEWVTPNGVSIRNLDRELLQIMKRSGCRTVNLAFESGDEQILRESMKKYLDLEYGRQVREWCREAGINVNGMFILGMPGETPVSMRRTKDYAISLDLDGIGIFIATPFPGTELYDTCKENGYLDERYAKGDALFQSDPEVLHQPLIETPWLKRDQLVAFYGEFESQFMQNYYAKRPFARVKKVVLKVLQRAGWGR
ncbi:hypothetical protein CEE37_11735 [candidate division LCP-89 bacterium B3_LCP]|uniref:Uncharacterized protein n=1 Tax=candidate division LCP-89 bacterium B3_LCP TaxID=2012998 RepID=A0A532UVX5_UNCL8|nr:MAG: hypothetical protein CEE37_11735 [candidate division LCP-89 bacterium B3_LCP]